ncbi:hypothetical protein [Xanthomarina gelatinilytica]|uniref:hypothetical protein n=1 Tax=Xanthomarina gelatinilytica TaxID=1137281 RepID=UPI003AA82523
MKNNKYANLSQGFGLPEKSQNILTRLPLGNYSTRTKAKSLVGISTPFYTEAHRRQQFNLAGFFMRTISTFLFIVSAFMCSRPNNGGLVEATSVGRSLCGGSTNLDQSTTNRLVPLGGGFTKSHKEAAIMATTPTQNPFKVFTFAIGNRKRPHSEFNKLRTISTVARSEQRARNNLKGLRLTFIKCAPAKSQEVVA